MAAASRSCDPRRDEHRQQPPRGEGSVDERLRPVEPLGDGIRPCAHQRGLLMLQPPRECGRVKGEPAGSTDTGPACCLPTAPREHFGQASSAQPPRPRQHRRDTGVCRQWRGEKKHTGEDDCDASWPHPEWSPGERGQQQEQPDETEIGREQAECLCRRRDVPGTSHSFTRGASQRAAMRRPRRQRRGSFRPSRGLPTRLRGKPASHQSTQALAAVTGDAPSGEDACQAPNGAAIDTSASRAATAGSEAGAAQRRRQQPDGDGSECRGDSDGAADHVTRPDKPAD